MSRRKLEPLVDYRLIPFLIDLASLDKTIKCHSVLEPSRICFSMPNVDDKEILSCNAPSHKTMFGFMDAKDDYGCHPGCLHQNYPWNFSKIYKQTLTMCSERNVPAHNLIFQIILTLSMVCSNHKISIVYAFLALVLTCRQ